MKSNHESQPRDQEKSEGKAGTCGRSSQKRHKVWHALFLVILCGVAGWMGAGLHRQAWNAVNVAAAKSLMQPDYLAVEESYSRIENARKNFDGLCTQLRLDLEWQLVQAHQFRQGPNAPASENRVRIEAIVRDLEYAMKDSEGTDQQVFLAEDLLTALKRLEQYDRWLNIYLHALYTHPTHPVVCRFAVQACEVGSLTGRQAEVAAGLNHVMSVPFDFPQKERVETALQELSVSLPKERLASIKGS